MPDIDVGFAENCDKWQVESPHFPSKLGGKPAWLALEYLPTFEQLRCENCRQQMIFLCQIYAPYEECDKNFHRTLFIFICKRKECCVKNNANNLRVFRSSLSRQNNYYSFEPPIDGPVEFDAEKWTKLCNLCGCAGERKCSKCKTTYCCREHQIIDWKESHKNHCCKNNESAPSPSNYLFKEYEIVMETEEIEIKQINEADEMQKYEELKATGQVGTMDKISDAELQEHSAIDKDKTFLNFRKRIAQYPEQILRYERGGSPLWIAKEPQPGAIPRCEYCDAERQYEFQIMPQMLTILKETELDFGVLAIYTCKQSCNQTVGYKKEFIFKQDVSEAN